MSGKPISNEIPQDMIFKKITEKKKIKKIFNLILFLLHSANKLSHVKTFCYKLIRKP